MPHNPDIDPFDQQIDDAVSSRQLAELFTSAFDPSAPDGVLGFSFVTMAGLQRVADLITMSGPGILLDVGCGWGGPGLWLANTIGCDLIGVDSSRIGIERANTRVNWLNMQSTFRLGTLAATGLEDDSVDAAVSIDALHFAPDPLAAAREILRVVRPGGMFAATLWNTPAGPDRFTRDYVTTLAEAGWVIYGVEDHPEWLAAQLNLYEAAGALAQSECDAATQRLRAEGEAVVPLVKNGRRLLVVATRPLRSSG